MISHLWNLTKIYIIRKILNSKLCLVTNQIYTTASGLLLCLQTEIKIMALMN